MTPAAASSRAAADVPPPGRRTGLGETEAAIRRAQFGPNQLVRMRRQPIGFELVRQFVHPLALLLWGAGVLSIVAGSWSFAAAIVLVLVLNAVFAFAQELQAERAVEALRDYLPPQARVRRDDVDQAVPARELVPGDLIIVAEGERISADADLVSGYLQIDESALTGESQPVVRDARSTDGGEDSRRIRSGTLCVGGSGEAVVAHIGMSTELGRIALLSQRVRVEPSPLEVQVRSTAILIAIVAVALGLALLPLGIVAGLGVTGAITFAIGLLVANVPEGLLPTITLALAVAVRHLARRRALVKRLSAVETLGSTDVICTDKTGTLTENRLTVAGLWVPNRAGTSFEPAGQDDRAVAALQVAALCSSAELAGNTSGDPTEVALLLEAARLGIPTSVSERDRVRVTGFPFDPRRRTMTTISAVDGGYRLDVKGAPEVIADRAQAPRGIEPDAWRRGVLRLVDDGAAAGLRMLALATRQIDDPTVSDRDVVERDVEIVGIVGLADRLRPEVPAAVEECHQAGIRVVMVTGDHGLTALAIARQAGIVGDDATVMLGAQADALTERELARVVEGDREIVFARSSPETKLRLAGALQHLGLVVAMTGDGVNDAPALRRADIGVAMGRSGTDVAREAAAIVLTDDNFATIAAAVREGRRVYENIRKFIVYVFAHATPEVVAFLAFSLSGGAIPLPLTAVQILAIDLGTETLPALALGREPAEPDVMRRGPRARDERIVTREMLVRSWLFLGLISAALSMTAYGAVMWSGGWRPGESTDPGAPLHHLWVQATTITFLAIVSSQIGTAFASRTERASLRGVGLFSNRLLYWGIAFELVAAAAVVWLPPLQYLFGTTGVTPTQLLMLLPFPFVVWGADELRRWLRRRRVSVVDGEPARTRA